MSKDRRSFLRKALSVLVEKADQRFGSQELVIRCESIRCRTLPGSFDGYRIVQVSDLHGQCFGREQETLLEAVVQARPDLICLTGDYIRREYDEEEKRRIEPFLRRISRIAPTYAIEGNHESRIPEGCELMRDMKRWGIHVLEDQGLWLTIGEERIGLAGLCTRTENRLRHEKGLDRGLLAQGAWAMRRFSRKDYVLLLAHCPEKIREYHRMGANLVLSGHAHGGLVTLPGGRALLAPGQGLFPRYTRGLYRYKETRMEVSAGLGGPRIGIPKEIVCIELRKE